MAAPTGYQLWTLALLIYLIIVPILALYVMGSGLASFKMPLASIAPMMVTVALGAFSFALVWWGERWGYVSAIVTGVLIVLGISSNIRAVGRGDRPNAILITSIPGLFFAAAVIYAATLGWLG